jgi:single-strand DNA-binding protein
MNSINIVATMTRDCELKYTQSGVAIGSFGIAYNEKIKQNGTYQDKVNFFDVVCFSKTAENVNQFFRKGSQIGISGSLNFEQWKANDGSNRSKVNIKMQSFTFIDKKQDNKQQHPQGQYQTQQQQYQPQAPQQQQYQQQAQQAQQAQAPQQQIQIQEDTIPF